MLKRMLLLLSCLSLLGGARPAEAQQRQVTGVVTGANQAPLAGAAVTISGTRRGTVTDAQGRFSLSLPGGDASLTVGLLGYTSRTVAVPASQSTVNVQLQQDILNLEGLVVTGQATAVARQNLPQSVAVVTAQELQRAPAQTVEKALQGKIAGANISQNSGAPGGGVQIQLRGVSSISGNADPLFVVDGVIVSNSAVASGQNAVSQASRNINFSTQDQLVNRIADLNPNDIESIEVLKGASAAAIYGSKASNGVIIITTKKGRAGPAQFNFEQRMGYYEIANKLGARTWTRDAAIEAFGLTAAEADQYFNPDGSQRVYFDNEEAVFGRRAPSTETVLSISGGSQNTRYYVSGSLLDHEGIADNTGYGKQSLQLNLSQSFSDRVQLSVNTNVVHSVAARGLTGNDNNGVSYYAVLAFTPSFFDLRARNPDGTFVRNPYERSNPVQTAALSTNDEDVWRAVSAANLSIDLFRNDQQSLRFVGIGGLDYFNQRNELYYPRELQFEPNDDGLPGTAVLGVSNNLNLNTTLNLVHSWTPGSFTATTSAGAQYEDRDLEVDRTVGRNIASGIRIPSQAANVTSEGFRQRSRDLGLYFQEELLLLNDRLNLTGSVRADRSSLNADPDKYYLFPKAAASFRFDEPMSWLNDLKLRVAYGESGNLPTYGQSFTPALGGTNLEGVVGTRVNGPVGDPDLRPERTRELEGGFDAVFLNGNARFEFTAYNKQVRDFIISPPLAPSSGFGAYTFNGGELENNGIEMMLEATPLRTDRFNWITRTTFARNRSEVKDLAGLTSYNPGNHFGNDFGGYRVQVGESPTAMWGFHLLGDGTRQEQIFGDADPDFRMGFSNDFTFGGFILSSLLDWQKGGLIANLTRNYYDEIFNTEDFTGCNTADTCSALERLEQFHAGESVYIEDASYVKLRELSVAYDLPSSLFGRLGGDRVRNMRLTLSGRNLITWTEYTGLDPEVSNFGNRPVGRNQDVTPFPPSRSFWLGLQVGF
ncbi:MAG TPA: SusC/RagA family TonB-linked outer membrane protein [Longimicrobiaceae bacterium]|nr:SusC/RagA family TonB-linked outer membrane protein [Longimicrobiaceae bacterium]